MLNTGKGIFAVGTTWSLGGFDDFLGNMTSSGGADGSDAVGPCVVGVTSCAGNSVVCHFYYLMKKRVMMLCCCKRGKWMC